MCLRIAKMLFPGLPTFMIDMDYSELVPNMAHCLDQALRRLGASVVIKGWADS